MRILTGKRWRIVSRWCRSFTTVIDNHGRPHAIAIASFRRHAQWQAEVWLGIGVAISQEGIAIDDTKANTTRSTLSYALIININVVGTDRSRHDLSSSHADLMIAKCWVQQDIFRRQWLTIKIRQCVIRLAQGNGLTIEHDSTHAIA